MIARLFFSAAVVLAGLAPAEAGYGHRGATLRFGPDCARIQRATGLDTVVVGTVLGGQDRRGRYGDGTFRDYRTFQACFSSVDACHTWAARTAGHHPMPPGYARCTPVFIGRTPDGPARAIRARY